MSEGPRKSWDELLQPGQFRHHMGQTASRYRLERRQEIPVEPLDSR